MLYSLCNSQWEYVRDWFDGFAVGQGVGEQIRIPHNVQEMPLHYGDHNAYQTICGYRMKLFMGEDVKGKRHFLQFDGAAHIATVYVNGVEVGHHRTGYTGFRVEITDAVTYGQDNWVAVKLDTTENGAVPPFGFVIDYLTYGGLYREVWLDVRETSYIEDVYITTPTTTRLQLQVTAVNGENCKVKVELLNDAGKLVLVSKPFAPGGKAAMNFPKAKPWTLENPYRYTCRVTLLDEAGAVIDVWEQKFGFRIADRECNLVARNIFRH